MRLGVAAVLLCGTLALPVPASAAPHAVDGSDGDWHHVATMVPGTAAYAGGEWAYTDYVYDEALAYPAGYGANAADVVLLQIAADADAVRYLVRLNTLLAPDSTVVALAVDTDCNDLTGGGTWPYGGVISSPGWEHVITAWGTGASAGASAANTHGNFIEFEVPRSFADPGTGTWCYRGASGLWDPAAGAWQPQGVYNLMFRNRLHDGGTEATDENASGDFQNDRQAAALGSGDIAPFVRRVDFGLLASGANASPVEPPGDVHITRIYPTAPNSLPEGVSADGATGSLYNGSFQPYRMFVPDSYRDDPRPAPLIPLLHGWTGNHRGFNPSGNSFWTDVVRANRALVPKPLGMGEEIWYEHVGEVDVLEVMADVARHYSVDPDRVYLGGTSMGGLGTIKIAEAHPDLFAGIFPSVPPMSDRAQGYALPANNDWDLAEVAGSLRNLPVRNFTGTYDALVPAGNDSRRFCEALAELNYDHDCWRDISSGGTHRGYENDRAAQIAQMMSEHPSRVKEPAHVTYASDPAWRRQAAVAGVSDLLPYDSAYWVSHIRWTPPPADAPPVPDWPTDPGTVRRLTEGQGISSLDVRTTGLGEGDPVATPIADDPSPTLVRSGTVLRPGPPVPALNTFQLAADGVLGLRLDLARMGLTLSSALAGRLTGSGILRLELSPASGTCAGTYDGSPVEAEASGGVASLTLDLASQARYLVLSCA